MVDAVKQSSQNSMNLYGAAAVGLAATAGGTGGAAYGIKKTPGAIGEQIKKIVDPGKISSLPESHQDIAKGIADAVDIIGTAVSNPEAAKKKAGATFEKLLEKVDIRKEDIEEFKNKKIGDVIELVKNNTVNYSGDAAEAIGKAIKTVEELKQGVAEIPETSQDIADILKDGIGKITGKSITGEETLGDILSSAKENLKKPNSCFADAIKAIKEDPLIKESFIKTDAIKDLNKNIKSAIKRTPIRWAAAGAAIAGAIALGVSWLVGKKD